MRNRSTFVQSSVQGPRGTLTTPFHAKSWAHSLSLSPPLSEGGGDGLSRSIGNARLQQSLEREIIRLDKEVAAAQREVRRLRSLQEKLDDTSA